MLSLSKEQSLSTCIVLPIKRPEGEEPRQRTLLGSRGLLARSMSAIPWMASAGTAFGDNNVLARFPLFDKSVSMKLAQGNTDQLWWKGKAKAQDSIQSEAEVVEAAALEPTPIEASSTSASPRQSRAPPPKGWVHFVAGGVGGMCGAIITSPLDVVKTRLQSDMYAQKKMVGAQRQGALRTIRNLAWHFVETGHLLGWVLARTS